LIELLRNSGAELRHRFYADGVAIAADGDVTYAVTGATGTVLAAGTADHVTDYYRFTLDPLSSLNRLTVTWTGTFGGIVQSQDDQVEIVGGVYVPLAELKAMVHLPGATTNDQLLQVRRDFEDLAEAYCRRVALIPRFELETIDGNNKTHVQLGRLYPIKVVSVSVDGHAVTDLSGYKVYDHGRLENLTAGFSRGSAITVGYEHGVSVRPAGLARITKLWVRQQLQTDATGYARDVLSQNDRDGFATRYSTPDWNAGRPTGMFDVDRTLNAIRSSLRLG
jgi:hypothetical protein